MINKPLLKSWRDIHQANMEQDYGKRQALIQKHCLLFRKKEAEATQALHRAAQIINAATKEESARTIERINSTLKQYANNKKDSL